MLVERTLCQTLPRATNPSRAVTRRIAPERKIQIVSTFHSTVSDELEHAPRAWVRYQSTRQRDAVYGYLNAVFVIVQRWKKQHRAKASSLELTNDAIAKAREAAKSLLDDDALQALAAIRRLQQATERKVRENCPNIHCI